MSTVTGQFFGVKAIKNYTTKFHKLQLVTENKVVALSDLEVVDPAKILIINLVHQQIFFEDLWVDTCKEESPQRSGSSKTRF